jgi:hypothetical protein
MLQRLRERRRAIIVAAGVSLLVSVIVGVVVGVVVTPAWFGTLRPKAPLRNSLTSGLNTAAVVFWIFFLPQFLVEMSKSPAVLELERRVKMAEELFKRRAPR